MEYARDRRCSGESFVAIETDLFEDFYIDYLDTGTLVMKHICFYEVLEDKYKVSPGLRRGNKAGDYPVCIHTVPNRRRHTDATQKRLLFWSELRRLLPFSPQENRQEFWVDGFVVDAVLSVMARRIYPDFGRYVHILDYETGGRVAAGTFVAALYRLNTVSKDIQFIVIPFCKESHWHVIIADIRKIVTKNTCDYWFLESMGGVEEPSLETRNTWQTFVCKITPGAKSSVKFNRLMIDHAMQSQSDKHNCGVFILFFVQCLLKQRGDGFRIGLTLNANEYRRYISMTLLHYSEALDHICVACTRNFIKERQDGWVQCDYCSKWFHLNEQCLASEVIDFQSIKDKTDEAEFICSLCRLNADRYDEPGRREEILSVRNIYEKYQAWEETKDESLCGNPPSRVVNAKACKNTESMGSPKNLPAEPLANDKTIGKPSEPSLNLTAKRGASKRQKVVGKDFSNDMTEASHALPAFVNQDLSCYANSDLQCLLSYEPLRYALSCSPVDTALKRLATEYVTAANSRRQLTSFDVRLEVDLLCSCVPQARNIPYANPEQQDAQLFLISLINCHHILNEFTKFSVVYEKKCGYKLCGVTNSSEPQCDNVWRLSTVNSHKTIAQLLEIPSTYQNIEDYKCPTCGNKSTAQERTVLQHPSQLFVVQLLIFGQDVKNTSFRVNNVLDITIDKRRYELHGAVFHHGGRDMNGDHYVGHYTAIIRSGKRFIRADDSRIQPCDWPEGSKDAFLLFYRRTN
ncbi:hypothetical protein BC332_34523 [Capsicum chinense]|nr:hypothetical protein BC332_34523 [Capsicum chinense]